MSRSHEYTVSLSWTGARGVGTRDYKAYGRDHLLRAEGKPAIAGSADPAFRGDRDRWNPEESLVGSLSACHMLWYLHLCAVGGITVLAYEDTAEGVMAESPDGGGRFVEVVLRPRIRLAPGADVRTAADLHHEAHAKCFIANSVNFPVKAEPDIVVET